MSKKKKYLILLLITLVLAAVTAGIYLFIKSDSDTDISYEVDKYSDVTNWCNTNVKDNTLSIDCKALLINIDTNSCFEVQVITNDKELKDLTVCESGDTLTYTNDVLGYRKLMPIDMVFTYTKKGILGDYSFNNVSFDKVDDTYIQGIVNEDIANLVTIDPSTTTIQNSVNFCPKPEMLPSYIVENNQEAYSMFYGSSKLGQSLFFDGSLYDSSAELKLVFGCESQIVSGYTLSCVHRSINFTNSLEQALSLMPKDINFTQSISESDIIILRNISIIYDGAQFFQFSDESDTLEMMIKSLNESNVTTQEVYCSMYKLFRNLSNNSANLKNYLSYMEDYINKNIKNVNSGLCVEAFDETKIDVKGIYLKNYFMNFRNSNQFLMINNCINLGLIIE